MRTGVPHKQKAQGKMLHQLGTIGQSYGFLSFLIIAQISREGRGRRVYLASFLLLQLPVLWCILLARLSVISEEFQDKMQSVLGKGRKGKVQSSDSFHELFLLDPMEFT